MQNTNGSAYGLTTLCPIKKGGQGQNGFTGLVREHLDNLPTDELSPMAAVPETYLCRLFVLDKLTYQGLDLLKVWPQPVAPKQDSLKSAYLVFSTNFHGPDLEAYLQAMWNTAETFIRETWQHCVAFEDVDDGDSFVAYIKRCQVNNTFYFNGSNDEPLADQLKGIYLKQELSNFAFDHQGLPAGELQAAFRDFVTRTQPLDILSPSFRPGAATLDRAVVGEPAKQPSGSVSKSETKSTKFAAKGQGKPADSKATSGKQVDDNRSPAAKQGAKKERPPSGEVASGSAAATGKKNGKGKRKSKQAEVA